MTGKRIDELAVGNVASFQKTISESDIYLFAGITGDFNPLHINKIVAEDSMFSRRIAHGMLSASLISTVLGQHLPGQGTIYLAQEIKFNNPVYIGDTITAEVKVQEIKADKNVVILQTNCTNQKNELILEGKAVVKPPMG